MSQPGGDIPLIDDTPPLSPAASSLEKSRDLRKNITQKEKERDSIQSTRSKTSKISASSSDKKSVNKPTSRTITKPNQKPIQPSNLKSPGKSLPEKSQLKDRPGSGSSQTAPEKVGRTGNLQRPTSGSARTRTTPRTTAAARSKPSGETESDTVKSKSNTVVANKSKAINRGSSTTSTTSVVNKTTTKQVSNNKVDSKSKIKEPPHQQNTNNLTSKKCLPEKSLKEIATDVGGRNTRNITGGGSHPVIEQRHNYIYSSCSIILIFFSYRCEIVQNDNI